MTTTELDNFLLGQFTTESLLTNAERNLLIDFNIEYSSNPSISELQKQALSFCLKSKGFLCSHYLAQGTPTAIFSAMMKEHINKYRNNLLWKENKPMKNLLTPNINILTDQISMLAMHTQFKTTKDIHNPNREEIVETLNPESILFSISLYVYYTILENPLFDEHSYNELFVRSWCVYYNKYNIRRLMFEMNGNNWKTEFKGVLLE